MQIDSNITNIYNSISNNNNTIFEILKKITNDNDDNTNSITNSISIINDTISSIDNRHTMDVSRLENEIKNTGEVITLLSIENSETIVKMNETIFDSITIMNNSISDTIREMVLNITSNIDSNNDSHTNSLLLLQQTLLSNVTAIENAVLLNITSLQNSVTSQFDDHANSMSIIITNSNRNFTNVLEIIENVRYATSINISDIQALLLVLQNSMVEVVDNFIKSDNITKQLLSSTITELTTITDTTTNRLALVRSSIPFGNHSKFFDPRNGQRGRFDNK